VLWVGLALLVGAAAVVRLLYRPPEDAHERMHAEEARAQSTIESLAQLSPQQQLRELEAYLSLESPIAVRTAAVEAIARIDAPDARALLREAMRDFASPVRTRVAEMATRQPPEDALELLVDCLADHDTEVRQVAINGLQRLRDRRAVGALIALLRDDPNEQTQHMAMGALRALRDSRSTPATPTRPTSVGRRAQRGCVGGSRRSASSLPYSRSPFTPRTPKTRPI
jgi:FOG: HEAT repeat